MPTLSRGFQIDLQLEKVIWSDIFCHLYAVLVELLIASYHYELDTFRNLDSACVFESPKIFDVTACFENAVFLEGLVIEFGLVLRLGFTIRVML